jgi:hypothetical protein
LQSVVWGSMQVRQLCQQVGHFAHVSHDTVFLQYTGSVLDPERRIHDPPAIRTGARVYAFFSIARALHFVVHLMQGGSPPPPPTPPAPVPSGSSRPSGGAFPASLATVPSNPIGPSVHPGAARPPSMDKLRSTFKCPKFLGEVRGWKVWNQGFIRFLSINNLDHVIEEGFLTRVMTSDLQADNKLLYYILEDAVAGSTVASKYIHRAAVWNGHEAYFILYDGYALSGPATASILLTELSNFRFKSDETPSEVVLRLQEIFDELESAPGNAAMVLHDTQKINYLLSAMRPERSLASVYSLIQAKQVRSKITYEKACDDLRFRCEALRADDLLYASHQPTRVRGLLAAGESLGSSDSVPGAPVTAALITTADKRQNQGAPRKKELAPCLVKGCEILTPTYAFVQGVLPFMHCWQDSYIDPQVWRQGHLQFHH